MQDIKHSCPDSSGDRKNLFMSEGADRGCLLRNRWLKPCRSDPSEKATFANRAVEISICALYRMRNSSIMRLLAPIMLTGFVALSVETQKYFWPF